MITPSGHKSELQIHSKESFEIKTKAHEYYDISRDETGKYTEEEKADALKKQDELFAAVPIPKNIDKIKSY